MTQSDKKRACLDRLVIDLTRCSLAACCQTQKHSTDDISINCTPWTFLYAPHTEHMYIYTYFDDQQYVIYFRQTGTKFYILDIDSQERKNVCLSDKSLFVCLFAYCFSKQQIIDGKRLFLFFLDFFILFSYHIYFTLYLKR
jgi:hypothetical protein